MTRSRFAATRAEIDLLVSDPDASGLRELRWNRWAACGGDDDPELLFPEPDSPQAPHIAAVLARCRERCPVLRVCAAWAVAEKQCAGIAGGMLLVDSDTDRIELQLDLLSQIAAGTLTPGDAQDKAGPIKRGRASADRPGRLAVIRANRTPQIEAIVAASSRDGLALREVPRRVLVLRRAAYPAGGAAFEKIPVTSTDLEVR